MKAFQTTIHVKWRYPAHLAAIRTPIANAAHNKGTGTLRPPVVVTETSSFTSCGWFLEY
ncbi:hypothetical protein Hanom_Chr06g00495141 [Helianthus anomalus]